MPIYISEMYFGSSSRMADSTSLSNACAASFQNLPCRLSSTLVAMCSLMQGYLRQGQVVGTAPLNWLVQVFCRHCKYFHMLRCSNQDSCCSMSLIRTCIQIIKGCLPMPCN